MNRARRAATKPAAPPAEPESVVEDEAPPRVHAIAEVANREERKRLLSGLMRELTATGAERVAAARLLEAMERTDSGSDQRGLPPPTNKAEQTARLVRVLTAAGPTIMLAALEILAKRREHSREIAFKNRAEGLNPMSLGIYQKYKKRIFPKQVEDANGQGGDGIGPGSDPGGVAAADAGVPELRGAEEFAEPAAQQDEFDGEYDNRVDAGEGGADAKG